MIEIIKNFFNKNVYERIVSGIFFIIPFVFLIIEGGLFFVLFFIILLVIIIFEFIASTKDRSNIVIKFLTISFFIVSFFHFIFLRISFDDFIINYLLYIIFSIWIFDSFSLIGGRLIGGKKLIPQISPNKTISGFISGLVSLLFFSILLMIIYNQTMLIILTTLLIGIISFIGDAIESYCKRLLKIKDFSNLLPGHGGIIDRMDAFMLIFFLHYILTISSFNPIIFYV